MASRAASRQAAGCALQLMIAPPRSSKRISMDTSPPVFSKAMLPESASSLSFRRSRSATKSWVVNAALKVPANGPALTVIAHFSQFASSSSSAVGLSYPCTSTTRLPCSPAILICSVKGCPFVRRSLSPWRIAYLDHSPRLICHNLYTDSLVYRRAGSVTRRLSASCNNFLDNGRCYPGFLHSVESVTTIPPAPNHPRFVCRRQAFIFWAHVQGASAAAHRPISVFRLFLVRSAEIVLL